MGAKVRVMRAALRTTVGFQDFTISGLGPKETIKAAMFIVAGTATADATATDDAEIDLAITDGTTTKSIFTTSISGLGDTDTFRGSSSNFIIRAHEDTVPELLLVKFISFITDGVRIEVTLADTARLVTVILWAGTDISAQVIQLTTHATENSTIVVPTDFEFDQMIQISIRSGQFNDSNLPTHLQSVGVCNNEGADVFTQGCFSISEQSSASTAVPRAQMRPNRVVDFLNDGAAAEITASSGTDFDITTRDDSQARPMAVLILSFGGLMDHWVDNDQTSPTSSGDHDVTDVGFMPQFAMHLLNMLDTANQIETNDTAGAFAIGSFDGTNEFTSGYSIEDATSTTDTQSRGDTKAGFLSSDDGATTEFDGTFDSFLSNGYRINYPSPNTTGRHWVALAVEEAPAAEQEGYRFREDDGNESGASWTAVQDTNITRVADINTRLRILTDYTGNPNTEAAALQYRLVGDADSEWRSIPL